MSDKIEYIDNTSEISGKAVRPLKRIMENKIKDAIADFECKTGLYLKSIELFRDNMELPETTDINVVLE